MPGGRLLAKRLAELAARRAEREARLALPAPPKRLALPAPPPPLPAHAVKTKGGQWANKELRRAVPGQRWRAPEELTSDLGYDVARMPDPEPFDVAHRNWLDRNLTKYLKTDLGTPDDPVHALWEQGVTHFPEVYDTTPPWSKIARGTIRKEDIGDLVGPDALASVSQRKEMLQIAPWLAKAPVTDPLYGLSVAADRRLHLEHLSDELHNALRPNTDLPPQLRIAPASMPRLSVPDAVQRVHDINQWRAANTAEANAARSQNPAVHTFKEYPDDPKGLKWVQLKMPEAEDLQIEELVDGDSGRPFYVAKNGDSTASGATPEEAADRFSQLYHRPALQDALKYEGDVMGHCVGGYCDSVMTGDSNIFSLRDAKGEPHVTIETVAQHQRGMSGEALNEFQPGVWDKIVADPDFYSRGVHDIVEKDYPDLWEKWHTPSIWQIKGKANTAPKEDYVPYVQDFVRSGKWGNVGDLSNARLLQLPDGRFIDKDQLIATAGKLPKLGLKDVEGGWDANVKDVPPTAWEYWHSPSGAPVSNIPRSFLSGEAEALMPHFEGFAFGGRVEAHRDFARNILPPIVLPRAA